MNGDSSAPINRRKFLGASAMALGACAVPAGAQQISSTEYESDLSRGSTPRNISSFRALDWQPYFDSTKNGAVLVDISSRALHFWDDDPAVYRLFPSSIPMTEDLTRRGRTSVVRKVEGPDWSPTPSMKARNPDWPDYIPPGPDNPLGTHALYLGWKFYRIHGTHDTRKIGRRSSSGCIGLYNEHIADLFSLAQVGTQVLII